MGRHSDYSDEKANDICQRLAEGESLRSICKDKGMPAMSTVLRWVAENTIFREQYAQAREVGQESIADEIMEISDADAPIDANGRVDNGWVQQQRLRVDSRKWLLAKQAPKKYGDRVTTELTGADGGAIEITETERLARLKSILLAAEARGDDAKH